MRAKGFRMVAPLLAITLGTAGCLVSASRYEEKSREADSLREALASTNRKNSTLQGENASAREQLDEANKENESLSVRTREQEVKLQRAQEELASVTRNCEGTRITREELISQLLEKEKATGKRIQELSSLVQGCDMEQERLRRERDMLLGRIERIREERVREQRLRDVRFTELAKTFSGISPQIATAPIGPAMRVRLPDKILFRKGKTTLTDAGKRVIGEMGKTVSDFPGAAIIISSDGKSKADAIRSLLTNDQALPPGKVLADAGNGGGETELLLVIP